MPVNATNTAAIQMEESTAIKRMGNDLLDLMVILMVGTCCSAADLFSIAFRTQVVGALRPCSRSKVFKAAQPIKQTH